MEPQGPSSDKKPTKGYGKRSIKQWIVIYVLVAIVVYGLIYYFAIHKSGGSTGGGLGY